MLSQAQKIVYGNFYDYDRCFVMIHVSHIIFYLFFPSNPPAACTNPHRSTIYGKVFFPRNMRNKSSVIPASIINSP